MYGDVSRVLVVENAVCVVSCARARAPVVGPRTEGVGRRTATRGGGRERARDVARSRVASRRRAERARVVSAWCGGAVRCGVGVR